VLTRRQFLACSALAIAQPPGPVRIVVRGSGAGSNGAALALEEMERTAVLVGRAIDRSPHAAAIVIEPGASILIAGGETFHVDASDGARREAIEAFRPDHPGSEPRDAIEWHPGLTRFGAEQLNTRYERRFGEGMTAAEWMGWMAVKAAVDAQLRQVPLARGRFDGHKGVALYFGPDRRLVQPLCIVNAAGALLGTI
jgi:hypothetical protein